MLVLKPTVGYACVANRINGSSTHESVIGWCLGRRTAGGRGSQCHIVAVPLFRCVLVGTYIQLLYSYETTSSAPHLGGVVTWSTYYQAVSILLHVHSPVVGS